MPFRAALTDVDTFVSGWGPVEDIDGLQFRWIQGPIASLSVISDEPWSRLRLHCRFVETVRLGVAVTVRRDVRSRPVGSGMLSWSDAGMQHRHIELDTTVAEGVAVVEFEPLESADERVGDRSLSLAVASLRVGYRHRRRSESADRDAHVYLGG